MTRVGWAMVWQTVDRNLPVAEPDAAPCLSEPIRERIRSFFPRYETKRAVLLPALHVVQNALGHVSWQAMIEVAELLEIHPSDVMDTLSFYTHFWTHHKGKKVIMACRSIACEIMGAGAVLEELKARLGVGEHGTTPDGQYSLVTEECIAGCDYAPCLLINEKLHKRVKPEDVAKILADPNNDQLDVPRSDLFDARAQADTGSQPQASRETASGPSPDAAHNGRKVKHQPLDSTIGTTSDVQEMRDAD